MVGPSLGIPIQVSLSQDEQSLSYISEIRPSPIEKSVHMIVQLDIRWVAPRLCSVDEQKMELEPLHNFRRKGSRGSNQASETNILSSLFPRITDSELTGRRIDLIGNLAY